MGLLGMRYIWILYLPTIKRGVNNYIPLFQNLPNFFRLTTKWLLHQNVNVLMSSHTMLGNHAQYSYAAY